MLLKINDATIAAYPEKFMVTPLDLDGESVRGADGTLNRDRLGVKRQIDMSWGALDWEVIATLLQSMAGVFFEFYYPDPMEGMYIKKTFYVGNRPSPFAVESNGRLMWSGLKVTLTER